MGKPPSPNGSNGQRDVGGRFVKGNKGGPGNPHGQQVGRIRAMILEAVTDEDYRAIVSTLVDKARDGDLAAIKLLFDRTLGRTPDPQLLDLQDIKERELAIAKQRAEAATVMADAAEERASF